ncbi:MAG: hypothetical protein ACRD0A_04720 [Acidimicrobiales bacterium]
MVERENEGLGPGHDHPSEEREIDILTGQHRARRGEGVELDREALGQDADVARPRWSGLLE